MMDSVRKTLRQRYRQIRNELPLAYQLAASAQLSALIADWPPYRSAKCIALYQAIGGEINLDAVWRSASLQGKVCYFPVLSNDKILAFLPAAPGTAFVKNRFGIAEPDVDLSATINPDQLDIIFLPLVAFDDYGTRLGMGAGYYDRSLAHVKRPLLIGVAYEFQHCPYIEPNAWDIPLNAVITAQKIHWSKPND